MSNRVDDIRRFVLAITGKYPTHIELFSECFRHRSVASADQNSNERLECLGDAVLGMIACEHLFKSYPTIDEGVISRLRMRLVNGQALGVYCVSIGISNIVETSTSSLRKVPNCKIFKDAFEAFVGAVYLDMGYDTAYTVCTLLFNEHFPPSLLWRDVNYKDILNKLQKRLNCTVRYQRISQSGPPHSILYTVQVFAGQYTGKGSGHTIKAAEQQASLCVLRQLGFSDFVTGKKL